MRKYLVAHFDKHKFFNESQHGFRSGRSCLSQLLAHFDKITKLLECGKSVDVIYVDFAKAFDKVDIGITLRKLKQLGVVGKLGRWLHNFLTGRTQTVVVNGRRSSPEPMKSGVPQGSVLGPLLFSIYTAPLGQLLQSLNVQYHFYADDSQLYITFGMEDSATAVSSIEDTIALVRSWMSSNFLCLNDDKSEVLLLASKHRYSKILVPCIQIGDDAVNVNVNMYK